MAIAQTIGDLICVVSVHIVTLNCLLLKTEIKEKVDIPGEFAIIMDSHIDYAPYP